VVDRDALAKAFGLRYVRDRHRGYGGTAHEILEQIAGGVPWRSAASAPFEGQGSMGNGGTMRVAPIGAYFDDDLNAVVENARASAEPTHLHPDGIAGAIAVAVAGAVASRSRSMAREQRSERLFAEVLERTPPGLTHDGLERAQALSVDAEIPHAAETLGNGSRVLSWDTVPFSIWCAARHLDDFEEAMWTTVAGLGDRDTTCAIVGGIVAAGGAAIPAHFLAAREALDSTLTQLDRYNARA
jgi:ADP-ribosylglycohydrolase